MVALVIGMLICVVLAVAIVAIVAVPARRDGRDVLSPRGEDIVSAIKDRTDTAKARFDRSEESADASTDEPSAPAARTMSGAAE